MIEKDLNEPVVGVRNKFLINLVKELKNSPSVSENYNSKLEEIAKETQKTLEKLLDINLMRNKTNKKEEVKNVAKRTLIRIFEVLSIDLFRSSNNDYQKASIELSNQRYNIANWHQKSMDNINFGFNHMYDLYENHNKNKVEAIKLNKLILAFLNECTDSDFPAKPNLYICPERKQNSDAQFWKETIGFQLEKIEETVLTAGAEEIFLSSVPLSLYKEIENHFDLRQRLLLEQLANQNFNFSIIKTLLQGAIVFHLGVKENINISTNIFPLEDELNQLQQRINGKLEFYPEIFDANNVEQITEVIFNEIFDEKILLKYKSKKLQEFYKNWLKENILKNLQEVLNCLIINKNTETDIIENGVLLLNNDNANNPAILTSEYINKMQNFNIEPAYDQIMQVEKNRKKVASKITNTHVDEQTAFKKESLEKDLNLSAKFIVENFSIMNILNILEDIYDFAEDNNLKGNFNELLTNIYFLLKKEPSRFNLLLMYFGYGFYQESFARCVNIDNDLILTPVANLFHDLIKASEENIIKQYEQFLRNLYVKADLLLDELIRNELLCDKEGDSIKVLNQKSYFNTIKKKYHESNNKDNSLSYLGRFIEKDKPLFQAFQEAKKDSVSLNSFTDLYKFCFENFDELSYELGVLWSGDPNDMTFEIMAFDNPEIRDNFFIESLLLKMSKIDKKVLNKKKDILSKYLNDNELSMPDWIKIIQFALVSNPKNIHFDTFDYMLSFQVYIDEQNSMGNNVFTNINSIANVDEWSIFLKIKEKELEESDEAIDELKQIFKIMQIVIKTFAPNLKLPAINNIVKNNYFQLQPLHEQDSGYSTSEYRRYRRDDL